MRHSRGNVLFLVLIAVALFAALGFAVTRNSGGSSNMSKNKADLAALDILAYTAKVQQAVDHMINIKGVSETDIDPGYTAKRYNGATLSNYWGNSTCTTNACRIFTEKGGRVPARAFTEYASNNLASGYTYSATALARGYLVFQIYNIIGLGTSKPDIVLAFYSIDPIICNALMRKLGLPENTSDISSSGSSLYFYQTAGLNELKGITTVARTVGATNAAFKGQRSFCEFTNGVAHFRTAIIVR